MIHNALTEVLEIQHPILLAPMGNVSGGALAAAVSEAGGMGLIGGGYGEEEWVRRECDAAGSTPVGIGFITWNLPQPSPVLDMALQRKPKAVFLSFGDPSPWLGVIRAAKCPLVLQVQSLEDARRAVDWGADVVVAQGTEAGGHGASRSTLPLVREVVKAISPLPVVAAGGITDGQGIAAALMLGASGALVGTRFMATQEALLSPRAKARLVETSGDQTIRSTVFDLIRNRDWPAPYTGRSLRNDFTDRWHGREGTLQRSLPEEQSRWSRFVEEENFDEALIFAGEGVGAVHEVLPARDVVAALMEETESALQAGAALVRG